MNQFTREALDFLKDIVVILVIVFVVRTFLIMPFQINGPSMYDSYYDKEFIMVDRFSYRDVPVLGQHREIQRGDVIVFKPGVSEKRKYFIKRIIGLPGETIKIEDGRVYLKDADTNEFIEVEEGEYLSDENNKNTSIKGNRNEFIYTVPTGRYFVMGDNRVQSTDSRTCFQSCAIRTNYISMSEITGKVLLDLGYFNIRDFSFIHPKLNIPTSPRFFNMPATHNYD